MPFPLHRVSRASAFLWAGLFLVAAAAVVGLGFGWARSHATIVRKGRERELRAELRASLAPAARALSVAMERARRGEDAGFAMERHRVFYRPESTPAGQGAILAGAERLEFVDGRPSAAQNRYRKLLDGRLEPTDRVLALRNLARLDLAAGEQDRAGMYLREAIAVAGATDEVRLLAAFELARIADGERATLLADLERGRFDRVAPRRRVWLHEALGGDPDRIAGLVAATALLGANNSERVLVLPEDRLCWRLAEDAESLDIATARIPDVLAATLEGWGDGRWATADPDAGFPLPAPYPEVRVDIGPGAVADAQAVSASAFLQRGLLAGGAAALLVLAGVLISLVERRRLALARRQTDFLWSVTHDLKTPIANIMLYAETIGEHGAEDPEAAERFSSIIRDEADRLLAKVQSVLDVAAGRRILNPADDGFDACAAVSELVEEYRAGADARQIEIALSTPEDPVRLPGSRELFVQAVGGLLDNGVRFAGGRVAVSLLSEDGKVRVEVDDDGPGIPPDERESAFRAAARPTGTGLGLAMVRRCVENGGGRVRIHDSDWGGARLAVEYGT